MVVITLPWTCQGFSRSPESICFQFIKHIFPHFKIKVAKSTLRWARKRLTPLFSAPRQCVLTYLIFIYQIFTSRSGLHLSNLCTNKGLIIYSILLEYSKYQASIEHKSCCLLLTFTKKNCLVVKFPRNNHLLFILFQVSQSAFL